MFCQVKTPDKRKENLRRWLKTIEKKHVTYCTAARCYKFWYLFFYRYLPSTMAFHTKKRRTTINWRYELKARISGSFTVLPFRRVTVSPCYRFTVSPFHRFAVLPFHRVTVSPCYRFTVLPILILQLYFYANHQHIINLLIIAFPFFHVVFNQIMLFTKRFFVNFQ